MTSAPIPSDVSSEAVEAALSVDVKGIQGFAYGSDLVIRDVKKRPEEQELWRAPEGSDMMAEIERIKMRRRLTAAGLTMCSQTVPPQMIRNLIQDAQEGDGEGNLLHSEDDLFATYSAALTAAAPLMRQPSVSPAEGARNETDAALIEQIARIIQPYWFEVEDGSSDLAVRHQRVVRRKACEILALAARPSVNETVEACARIAENFVWDDRVTRDGVDIVDAIAAEIRALSRKESAE